MQNFMGIGRLTKDSEFFQKDEKSYAKFTVAIDREGKDNGTDFFPCIIWGKYAEALHQYLKKGMLVSVMGNILISNYETESGEKKISVSVNCSKVTMLESKKKEESTEEETKKAKSKKK